MKKYIDEDIIEKTVSLTEKYNINGILEYAKIVGDYDFILPSKYYINIVFLVIEIN